MHEIGHCLGLPDYYDYNASIGPKGGVGGWDMMDSGWGDHNAFSKYLLGWIEPIIIDSGTQQVILPLSETIPTGNAVLIMPDAKADSFGEFFLVQYREPGKGNDPLNFPYMNHLIYPKNAVWIWHVDSTLEPYGRNFLYDNSYTTHKLLRLLEADGEEHIETGNGAFDINDFYIPGQSIGPTTVPNTTSYSGSKSGVSVTNIQQLVSSMQMDFSVFLQPVAAFSGTPSSGTAPLTVSFTDASLNKPTDWAWYFGDETYTAPWALVTAHAGWSARSGPNSVVMPDGSIVLMGGAGYNDTWRSTDNGATWTQMTAHAGWSARIESSSVVMPDGSIVLMGGTGYNDTWRSTDNGATWTQMTAHAGWSARQLPSSVVMPDGSIVLMSGYDGSYKNDVWRSTDNGATWKLVTASAEWSGRYYPSSVVMPDGSIVLMGGVGSSWKNDVWRSTDNGATWTQMTAHAGWSARSGPSSAVMPDGSIVLMGGASGDDRKNDVWRSTDNGATWTQLTASAGWSARNRATSLALPDGKIVLMGGQDSGGSKNDVWTVIPAGSSVQNPSHTYTTSGIYNVALQVHNTEGFNSTRKIGYITVTSPTSSISVTSPNGGETWQRGTSHTVTWSYTGIPGSTVKIVVLKAGIEVGTINASTSIGSGGTGSYTWVIYPSGSTGSDYKVSVQSTSQPTITDVSNNFFTITPAGTSIPSITVTAPNGGETWQRGTPHTVTWDYTGNPGSAVKIVVSKSGIEVGTIAASAPIGSGGKGSYAWTISSTGSTGSDYKVSVQSISQPAIKDLSNNYFTITSTPSLPVLTVSASPKTVSTSTPTNVIFTVRNATSNQLVSGATVTLTGVATGSGTTGANGNATISVNAASPGKITATASLTGYTSNTTTVTVATPSLSVLTVSASPIGVPAGTTTNVNFTVINAASYQVVSGATVTLTGVAMGTGTTGADGNTTISVNAGSAGTITATASKTGYTSGTTVVNVNAPLSKYGKIAFVSNRDGNPEIYIMNADGSGQTRLTNNLKNDTFPLWSPDGKKIAHLSDRDGNPEIYVMNADGSGQTRLTNNQAYDGWIYEGTGWSPDGKKITFISERDGYREFYVMNPDGSGQTRITNNLPYEVWEGSPALSPDGTKIAFSSNKFDNNGYLVFCMINVINVDGTGLTLLTGNDWPKGYNQVVWSPDGTKIAFRIESSGATAYIGIINSDGTTGPGGINCWFEDNSDPKWSPNGTKIAYVSFSKYGTGGGSVVTNVVGPEWPYDYSQVRYEYSPTWSPDSTKIAYGNEDIWVKNADGTGHTRLTTNPASDYSPSWGPAGTSTSSITVTSPNGGETWQRGTPHTVTWDYTGSPGSTVKIIVLKAGIEVGTINASTSIGSGGKGSYTWPIYPTGSTGGDYKVSVQSISQPTIKDTSNNYFTITPAGTTASSITVTAPNGGETWKRGTTHTVTWDYSGSPGTTVKIVLLKGGKEIGTLASSAPIGSSGKGSYTWTISSSGYTGSDFKVSVQSVSQPTIKDLSNNYFTLTL